MKKIFLIISLQLIFFSSNIYAWTGYDYKNDTIIEIYPGNYTQEGEIFEFYDESLNKMKLAKVIERNYFSDIVELKIIDLEDNQERIFEMEN